LLHILRQKAMPARQERQNNNGQPEKTSFFVHISYLHILTHYGIIFLAQSAMRLKNSFVENRFEVAAIKTKLIDVEGMPGSGKNTATRIVEDFLNGSGANASYYDEDALNHPADFALHAFIKNEQIRALTTDEQSELYSEGTKKLTGLVIPLTKVSVSLFSKIIPFKIYDQLDWETEKPILLEQWQNFAKKALLKSRMYVFNSGVLQNPMNEMMMRFGFSYPIIWEYFFNVYRSIAAMNPFFIYIKCTDIKARIEDEAKKRHSRWLGSGIEYHTSQGYGKRNGMTGLDGYVDCLEARQRIELKIINDLPVEKLILTDPFDNWEHASGKIHDFLKMKSIV
jgi:hypothetical protein